MTLVSPSRHSVLFLCEKNASTSLRQAIEGHDDWYRMQVSAWHKPDGPWDSWRHPRFYGVVRNPYERILSYWGYWTKVGERAVGGRSFEDWVLGSEKTDHTSQSEWYQHFPIYRYLRFETLQQDVESVLELPLRLPLLNASEHAHWREYYTDPDVVAVVNEWIGRDCAVYGYERISYDD